MTLDEGLAQLKQPLPAGAAARLAAYLELLAKWNRVYNLTAVRDPAEMVTHHLLDSLVVLPHLAGIGRLADVGSGAGLPGLPLAICRPGLQVLSVESNQKKAAFQQQAQIQLGLDNFSVHCGRVESVRQELDAVISRAFASLADFVALAGHLAGRLLAMKGVYPADELVALPAGWRLAASHELQVPGLPAQRHLLVLERN
jgi:16S rRNA (guanine527-N7)-methyltransferase